MIIGTTSGVTKAIADYVRWFKYEPQTHGADVRDPTKVHFDGSYRVTPLSTPR